MLRLGVYRSLLKHPMPNYTFLGGGGDATDSTTHAVGSFTATKKGVLVFTCLARNGSTGNVSGVDVGGAAAVLAFAPAAAATVREVWYREVGPGTYAITVTYSVTCIRKATYVHFLTDYLSPLPMDAGQSNNNAATNVTLTLQFPAEAIGVYGATFVGAGGITWFASQGEQATEQDDDEVEVTSFATAYYQPARGQAVAAIQAQPKGPGRFNVNQGSTTVTSGNHTLVGAVWR